ncbi:DUF4864 domain-containing protein [Yoonia sp. SS1-5]|uniref:DUF4864 domain-containing protein n=1 Tax=Yoonia rhodophyticola TaxID=3137370 RepID=A0AAN0M9Q0_9RHOB
MARIFVLILGLFLTATSTTAQQSDSIESVIGNQLQAFNDRDLQEAWSYASPNIKRIFENPQNFGLMVERGYPMVWDNRQVEFLERREVNGAQMQKVMLRDPSGNLYVLLYQMIETGNGWQINGVQLLPGNGVGA